MIIKRKLTWETRYALIRDAFFQYKKDRFSVSARYMVNLRQCDVRKGKLDNGQGFYEVKDKKDKSSEVVRIRFDTPEAFQEWGAVFKESIMTDEELTQRFKAV